MIPLTFEEWKNCIINDCKINLTKEFAILRLAVYENSNASETKKFVSLYGKQHLENVIHWLKRIQ